jgi:hypothetical protein
MATSDEHVGCQHMNQTTGWDRHTCCDCGMVRFDAGTWREAGWHGRIPDVWFNSLGQLKTYVANPQRRDPMEWQPIETAPKDGTKILGYGQWAGEINGIVQEPRVYIVQFLKGGTDYPGFEWAVDGTDAYAAWCKPSHWQPLPPPPVTPSE